MNSRIRFHNRQGNNHFMEMLFGVGCTKPSFLALQDAGAADFYHFCTLFFVDL